METDLPPSISDPEGSVQRETKKARCEHPAQDTPSIHEIVKNATSAVVEGVERYVKEKSDRLLSLLQPSVGPHLSLPPDYDVGKHLVPLLRETTNAKLAYCLNILNLLSFDSRNSLRLSQYSGILPWLLDVLDMCLTDSLVESNQDSNRVPKEDTIEREIVRSRSTKVCLSDSENSWWWYKERGLFNHGTEEISEAYARCIMNILRNFSFNAQNWDHLTSPRALARILRCLDEQPLVLDCKLSLEGDALDILENTGRKIRLKDIDAHHDNRNCPAYLRLSRRPSLVLSVGLKNAIKSSNAERRRKAANIISILSESKLNETYLGLMLMSEDVQILDSLVENLNPWLYGTEVARSSLTAINCLICFRGTLMKMTLAKKKPLLQTLVRILQEPCQQLLKKGSLAALNSLASSPASVRLLDVIENDLVELALTNDLVGPAVARILHKMTYPSVSASTVPMSIKGTQGIGSQSTYGQTLPGSTSLSSAKHLHTSERIGSLTKDGPRNSAVPWPSAGVHRGQGAH